ncbi:MAG: hypothetical protein PHI63_06890 [Patescibacteria group bacterium]|nr:hypothetical protein [Patescibacteria group bacterium]
MTLRRPHSSLRWRCALAFWIFVPLLLMGWILIRDVVPGGQLAVTCWGTPRCLALRGPVPESRVVLSRSTGSGQTVVQLIGEPVYFDVYQSRPFRTAEVRLTLHPGDAQVIEMGVAAETGGTPTLQPLYHRALEQIAENPEWSLIADGAVMLWQRGSTTYPTVSAFMQQPPDPYRVAAYRTTVTLPFAPQPLLPGGPGPAVDYILTGYRVTGSTGWRDLTVTFTLTPEQSAASTLRFVLSIPERPLPAIAPQLSAFTVRLQGELLNVRVLRGWMSRWFRPNAR